MFVFFSFPQISQVLNLQTLASSSSYQLPMEHKLDKGFKVRDVFLDIFKLKHNGISGILLRLIKDCVSGRKQRVTFNGQCSLWMDIQQEFLKTLCLDLYFFFNLC